MKAQLFNYFVNYFVNKFGPLIDSTGWLGNRQPTGAQGSQGAVGTQGTQGIQGDGRSGPSD